MAHRDLGFKMMERLAGEVSEVGMVETRPKIEGPNLSTIIAAKKAPGKGAPSEASRSAAGTSPARTRNPQPKPAAVSVAAVPVPPAPESAQGKPGG